MAADTTPAQAAVAPPPTAPARGWDAVLDRAAALCTEEARVLNRNGRDIPQSTRDDDTANAAALRALRDALSGCDADILRAFAGWMQLCAGANEYPSGAAELAGFATLVSTLAIPPAAEAAS